MPQTEDEIIRNKLEELGIAALWHEHPAIMTVEEGEKIAAALGSHCMKNLFLCARKKHYYLYLLPAQKSLDSKALAAKLSCGHLSFGSSEKMAELLHTYPGAVTSLGLIFDTQAAVTVLVDREIAAFDAVDAHPCRNTASVKIAVKDLIEKWIPATGHTVTWI